MAVLGLFLLVPLGLNLAKPQVADASTSSYINFQARLEALSGAIAPDGNYNIEFKLYTASSGAARFGPRTG